MSVRPQKVNGILWASTVAFVCSLLCSISGLAEMGARFHHGRSCLGGSNDGGVPGNPGGGEVDDSSRLPGARCPRGGDRRAFSQEVRGGLYRKELVLVVFNLSCPFVKRSSVRQPPLAF